MAITLGLGGLTGWRILQRTEETHRAVLARSASMQRSTAYFRDTIATAATADDLVSDYKLLNVALKAFGLESDLGNRAFIRKVLESDLSDKASLVNRLSDKRYTRLAEAFGYASGPPMTSAQGFGDRIASAFLDREFETQVGTGDENLRLALNARRELSAVAGRTASSNTLWFEVMGNPPLRKVFDTAFGFGSNVAKLDVDRQLEEFKAGSRRAFGTDNFVDLTSPAAIDALLQRFLVGSQVQSHVGQNRYSSALALLARR